MKEVTKDEFYAVVGPMNVYLRTERDRTVWETPDRRVIGITTPGYLCVGKISYFLPESAA